MEKKVAFVSFGGSCGKFPEENYHLRLDGRNFDRLKKNLKNYWRDEYWRQQALPEIKEFWDLNGWDWNENSDMFEMYISVDGTGWHGCASAFESLDKVFEGYHYCLPNCLFIPASVVENMLNNTDDKTIEVIVPWWKWKNYEKGERDIKNFVCELHMVDAYEQLPAKL